MELVKNQTNILIFLFAISLGIALGILAVNYSNLPLGFGSIVGWCILMLGYFRKRKIMNRLSFISALSLIVGWSIYIKG